MSEDLSDFVNQNWREDYERGLLKAGYEAALFCIANGQAIPAWLAPMAERALRRDFVTSEGRGRGRGRGGLPAFRESRKSSLRSFILAEVDRLADSRRPDEQRMVKRDAFEVVARDLDRHEAKPYWTAEMVKAVYYRNR